MDIFYVYFTHFNSKTVHIENNEQAIGSKISRRALKAEIVIRAEAYGK
jgi:hypothetical protein